MLKLKTKISLICFDMWETLCHGGGRRQIEEVRAALKGNHIEYEPFSHQVEQILMTKNQSLEKGMKDLVKELNLPADENNIKEAVSIWVRYVKSLKPFPEAEEVLKKLHKLGIKLCLVSNSDPFSVRYKVTQLGWEKYFSKLFISAELGFLKPDKRVFQAIEDYFKLPKNEVLFVDDSLYHGVVPARKFGWQSLWINRNRQSLNGVFKFL